MNSKPEAKDLPCIFVSLSNDSRLAQCETKDNQRWRHASGTAAVKGLTEMAKYFPELSLLLDSLESHSLCERHYNQVIVKRSFIKQISKPDDSNFSDSEEVERKRRRLTDDNDELQARDILEKSFSDFGVQVSLLDPEHEMLLKRVGELENINRQLSSDNEALKRLLDGRLANEQDRVKLVTEIAKMERRNVYNDITSRV
jgi:hypothetical protein